MSSSKPSRSLPHVALITSVGMGHLTPFFRFASMLSSRDCTVTLITPKSTISDAESNQLSFFLTTHQKIKHLEFETVPASNPSNGDPFFAQYIAISQSGHHLHPLLASASPPISAAFCDLMITKSVAHIAANLGFPFYSLITTSALFTCFLIHLPALLPKPINFSSKNDKLEIPGLKPISTSSIPLPFLNPNSFGSTLASNMGFLHEAQGILLNTFEWFETETIGALNSGKVLNNLPPVLPVGPLETYELEKDQALCMQWLDKQSPESVVYVSFGSRTATSNDQIRELSKGLEKSEHRFLWIVKTSIVDKDDKEDLKDFLGDSFLERTKNKGMVVKEWVNQQAILAHPATGGFVSHCGWNSVIEAAQLGVPVLAWPKGGDQRVNAEVVEKAGLGIWERSWGSDLVKEDEIMKKIVMLMEDINLRKGAKKVGEEARKATDIGGRSAEAIMGVIKKLSSKVW